MVTMKKQIVGAALVDSLDRPARLLAARRTAPPEFAGMWEFPGGKVESEETPQEALHRELAEELGVTACLGTELEGPTAQGWPLNASAAMRVWLARVSEGTPEPLEDHDLLQWVELAGTDIAGMDWIPADRPIVHALVALAAEMIATEEDGRITVDRLFRAPASEIFGVLSDPSSHAAMDGSGMVRSDEKTGRITAVGEVFTMNMYLEKLGGDYQTENHVVEYDVNKLLAWKTADAGKTPDGWQWVWTLEAKSPHSTKVSLSYDWSHVTDQDVLQRISFPLVETHQLAESLRKLADMVEGLHHKHRQ